MDSRIFEDFLRDISVCQTDSDQNRMKSQLLDDFKASDERLTKFVSEHRGDLLNVMKRYRAIYVTIEISRERCKSTKQKLISCMHLLQCSWEEIKNNSMESVEQKLIIETLEKIERLKKVPHKIESCLFHKEFLAAAKRLTSALSLVQEELESVGAVVYLKSTFDNLGKKLNLDLMHELRGALYRSPDDVFLVPSIEFESQSYDVIFDHRASMQNAVGESCVSHGECGEIHSSKYQLIIETLTLLKSLPDAIDILKAECEEELTIIVKNTSEVMKVILKRSFELGSKAAIWELPKQHQQRFLFDLVEAVIKQFRAVAFNHRSFLIELQKIELTEGVGDLSCYDMAEIYSKIQNVLEGFLKTYLDLQSRATLPQQDVSLLCKCTAAMDLSPFFLPKSYRRPRERRVLFKFDDSKTSLETVNFIDDLWNDEMIEETGLICEPNQNNITVIYKPLKTFITEIELALRLETGIHCPLHSFLLNCVHVYLDLLNAEVSRLLEKINTSLECWKISDSNNLTAPFLILDSTLVLSKGINELKTIMFLMPDYSNRILQLICDVLLNYKISCQNAFNELISLHGEDRNIFSVSWAKDQDIKRVLKSFPNWRKLHETCNEDSEEFPEEIRLRNREECDLVFKNLPREIDDYSCFEILAEASQLSNIALMQESMEWLSRETSDLLNSLPQDIASSPFKPDTYSLNRFGTNPKNSLVQLITDYRDLADVCLLVLHLEARAHCFYHFIPLLKQYRFTKCGITNQILERVVKNLTEDMLKMERTLELSLQWAKFQYVFQGVGEFMSAMLISSLPRITKIAEVSCERMLNNVYAIQQCLAGITMAREVSLDRAREYFKLLNLTEQEILDKIVEEGPAFVEKEYAAIFSALHAKKEVGSPDYLIYYSDKMRNLLSTFSAISSSA